MVQYEKVLLKNVNTPAGDKDITVEIVPFSKRNDDHVDFAYAVSDMFNRFPSEFRNISDAARRCVELFVVHTEEQSNDPNSDFSLVYNDTRAARTLYNTASLQKQLSDFFVNA